MDRDRIERNDFPTARRGYDRDEVRAHLREVAEEVERLSREQQRASELTEEVERLRQEVERLTREKQGWGLAGSAAEQIREIVAAAERTAAIINQSAEDEAQESRRREEIHRREVRKRAEDDAGEHVARVEQATERLLQQVAAAASELEQLLDALRREAGQLVDGIRGNVESVQTELRQIQGGVPALRGTPGAAESVAASAPMAATGEHPPVEDDAAPVPELDVSGEEDEELPAGEAPEEFEVEEDEPATEVEAGAAAAPTDHELPVAEHVEGEDTAPAEQQEPAAAEPVAREGAKVQGAGEAREAIGGSEGVRLVALNMALNGTPREDTARYLSENFDIEDQDAVLDEVYSRVGA